MVSKVALTINHACGHTALHDVTAFLLVLLDDAKEGQGRETLRSYLASQGCPDCNRPTES